MNRFSKWWQRWMLDSLTKEQPPLLLFFLTIFTTVFGIGFLFAHWIDQLDIASYKYYYGFSDNIGGRKIDLMIDILPVDVVYTWVNGSDPQLLKNLQELKDDIDGFACIYQNCFASSYASIYTGLDDNKDLSDVIPFPIFKSLEVNKGPENRAVKLVRLNTETNFKTVKEQIKSYFGANATTQMAYWTSEVKVGWSIEWKAAAIVRLSVDSDIHSEISYVMPDSYGQYFKSCYFDKHKDTYIIECSEESLIEKLKVAIELISQYHKYPKLWPAQIILQSDEAKQDPRDDFDVNRFVDNEELRYSLRSLEKYAPWIRKVFIVTNGQIPYWLNLDYPKLIIITHDEIFSNSSHLPTYSSPAIESHIHRIPGLSDNFLYLNDDVMLGDTVWPEDFYSPTSGYKIYLAWSLPECSSGCPGSWISDGYCDRACNTSECNWDGGDCPGDKEFVPSDYFDKADSELLTDIDHCSTSCADAWLGDTYCDTACNAESCGFDAGDCGGEVIRENVFQILYNVGGNNTIVIPKGTLSAWIDLSVLKMQHQNATAEGSYSLTKGVRTVVFNYALGMLMFVFKANYSGTFDTNITFHFAENEDKKQSLKVTMIIEFDSTPTSKEMLQNELRNYNSSFKIPHFNFSDTYPQILKFSKLKFDKLNISVPTFPKEINQSIYLLNKELKDGFISDAGYNIKKKLILYNYFEGTSGNTAKTKDEYLIDNFNKMHSYLIQRKLLNFKNKSQKFKTFENYLNSNKEMFLSEKHKSEILDFNIYKKENLPQNSISMNNSAKNENVTLSNSFNEFGTSGKFSDIISIHQDFYSASPIIGRKLLDAYSDSLLFVNRLFNSEYEFEARRVPAHMPHFISKKILEELHVKFSDEFYVTSSHKLRQGNDMQFSFSYFYYLISEKKIKTYKDIFHDFDTDLSGTWSDREIRTFLAKTNDLPLTYRMIMDLHKELKNCSQKYETQSVPTNQYERYADSDLPTVSEELVVKCADTILASRLLRLIKVPRFSFTIIPDSLVHFKMITSNLSTVVHQLDDVRKNSKKFICLNSDLDPKGKDNDLIRALMQDTYESLYPLPSSFELPYNYRNRFSYVHEVNEWKRWRNFFRALIYASISCLAVMTIFTFFRAEIETIRRRWCRRLKRKERSFGLRV